MVELLLIVAKSPAPQIHPGTMAVSVIALIIAAYGAWQATRTHRWQRKRDEQRQRSEIDIGIGEQCGFGNSDLIIGETVYRHHVLTVEVINRGEAPEYVHSIVLESESESPITVFVRRPEGTVEVRPRDQQGFELRLDGSQAFSWTEPFRATVRLANDETFNSPYGSLSLPPHDGEAMVVPDPDALPDDEVAHITFDQGSRTATVTPPASVAPPPGD
jgi:hypothetical protein